MSDIEYAEFCRKKEFYFATLANIERKLDERFRTLSEEYRYGPTSVWQENDPEMKKLRKLRDEINVWFFTVLDYYKRRSIPESDQEWRRRSLDSLYSPRYNAVMAWAMRRRR